MFFFFFFIYRLYSWCEMREYFRAKAEIVKEQEQNQKLANGGMGGGGGTDYRDRIWNRGKMIP